MSSLGDDLTYPGEDRSPRPCEGRRLRYRPSPNCPAGSAGTGPPDASTDGSADGHVPVGLPQVGTGAVSDQRAGNKPVAADPEGTEFCEAGTALLMTATAFPMLFRDWLKLEWPHHACYGVCPKENGCALRGWIPVGRRGLKNFLTAGARFLPTGRGLVGFNSYYNPASKHYAVDWAPFSFPSHVVY